MAPLTDAEGTPMENGDPVELLFGPRKGMRAVIDDSYFRHTPGKKKAPAEYLIVVTTEDGKQTNWYNHSVRKVPV